MNDNKITEVLQIMAEIMRIMSEIEKKNRETVDCITRAISALSGN